MNFKEQLENFSEQFGKGSKFKIHGKFNNIVISGMGGSGIVGRIFSELYSQLPVQVVSDYSLPDYCGKSTLFIGISYSGNTEETIRTTKEAISRGSEVLAITSGGELANLAPQVARVPPGLQPRNALGYMLDPLLNTFLHFDGDQVASIRTILKSLDRENIFLKEAASTIFHGSYIPWILGYSPYSWTAYRWRTQFNENSKIMAVNSTFPELNHNETMSLRASYSLDKFLFITLGKPDNERVMKRIRITSEITGRKFLNIPESGNTLLEKVLYMIHCGDYLTYYLAEMRNVDPMDVSMIEELKQKLA